MKYGFAAALFLLTACAGAPQGREQPSPQPTLLIQSRGVVVPLTAAVQQIAFRPLIPSAQIVAVALIPPLGGVDSHKTHGLAIEYAGGGEALLLSQWPRPAFDVGSGGAAITASPCAPVAFKADGLIWTTRNGLVMTLQPDGAAPASHLVREADRLMAAAGCRKKGR